MSLAKFVQEISSNKQQFKDFQMEIIESKETFVRGRMKGYGDNLVKEYNMGGVTVDDYKRFFYKKWGTIANCVNYDYKQEAKGEWIEFTVSKKKLTLFKTNETVIKRSIKTNNCLQ